MKNLHKEDWIQSLVQANNRLEKENINLGEMNVRLKRANRELASDNAMYRNNLIHWKERYDDLRKSLFKVIQEYSNGF